MAIKDDQKMRVFRVNEVDTVAAHSVEAAVEFYTREHPGEECSPQELDIYELRKVKDVDSGASFLETLADILDEDGKDYPYVILSTEY